MSKKVDPSIFSKKKKEPARKRERVAPPKKRVKKAKTQDNKRVKNTLGALFIFGGIYLLLSFFSYFFSWEADNSYVQSGSGGWSNLFVFEKHPALGDVVVESIPVVQNKMGKFGALLAHSLVYQGFGIMSLLLPLILINLGIFLIFKVRLYSIYKSVFWGTLLAFYVSVILGFFNQLFGFPHWLEGRIGFAVIFQLNQIIGFVGTLFVLLLSFLGLAIWKYNVSLEDINKLVATFKSTSKPQKLIPEKAKSLYQEEENTELEEAEAESVDIEKTEIDEVFKEEDKDEPTYELEDFSIEDKLGGEELLENGDKSEEDKANEDREQTQEIEMDLSASASEVSAEKEEKSDFEIVGDEEKPVFVAESTDKVEELASQLVDELGEYAPEAELSGFKKPTLELLGDVNFAKNDVSKEELESNKDKIVETLKNYKIEISKIKATIGPTVTLYEIVPAPGVRISKIKNLEDDIALSLAALGIRIIAPVPGRGTIGIEVPNRHPEIVSMKEMLGSKQFTSTNMELPVCLGKTISNENYIADLAKMPHLLVAGATGQGKSVGVNAILASLLYKKHPSLLKFVMIDPKKVELSLFSKIERHYLAKLPDEEEPIITETKKVINVLNSLCKEMDTRYELLKDAHAKNLKEYNTKFKMRKLNPQNGHRFMPYIVLVIDEFADLIMTAGKEVEMPIARLAQLARAIGIHLVIATQRPSVNIITGTIKANFPARIAFKVQSKIDSRTILDAGGADQLIGRGDMLLSFGSDMIRLQCPFIDTPEVEKISDYIGGQRAFSTAYLLPEVAEESSGSEGRGSFNNEERDALFEDAARVVVINQQGSTSLIQRKMKLGYNRAGRIMDQLEEAGIVGAFEGSKAREVFFADEYSLEQHLDKIKNENN